MCVKCKQHKISDNTNAYSLRKPRLIRALKISGCRLLFQRDHIQVSTPSLPNWRRFDVRARTRDEEDGKDRRL